MVGLDYLGYSIKIFEAVITCIHPTFALIVKQLTIRETIRRNMDVIRANDLSKKKR